MDTADNISREELQLAARNHGFPSEALAHDVTPIGLHYLLIHYDIPVVDETAWCLTLDGCVDRPLRLSLDDLASRPALTQQVTMECAGNGRTLLTPRSRSQPWVLDAVGTGAWTGTPLAPLLREAGVTDDAVEILFTGLDRGLEDGEEQVYELDPGRVRSRRGRRGICPQRRAPAAAARLPRSAPRARLVWHDQREVARPDHRDRRALHRLPAGSGVPPQGLARGPRHPRRADRCPLAAAATGHPRLLHPRPRR
jgi:hypothetical protein